jgi:hypothetical protein
VRVQIKGWGFILVFLRANEDVTKDRKRISNTDPREGDTRSSREGMVLTYLYILVAILNDTPTKYEVYKIRDTQFSTH